LLYILVLKILLNFDFAATFDAGAAIRRSCAVCRPTEEAVSLKFRGNAGTAIGEVATSPTAMV